MCMFGYLWIVCHNRRHRANRKFVGRDFGRRDFGRRFFARFATTGVFSCHHVIVVRKNTRQWVKCNTYIGWLDRTFGVRALNKFVIFM